MHSSVLPAGKRSQLVHVICKRTLSAEVISSLLLSLSTFHKCFPAETTGDGYEKHFQVNYLSHFLMTLHLLPLLRQSAPNSRIVNVSSTLHTSGVFNLENINGEQSYDRIKFYGNSKLYQVIYKLYTINWKCHHLTNHHKFEWKAWMGNKVIVMEFKFKTHLAQMTWSYTQMFHIPCIHHYWPKSINPPELVLTTTYFKFMFPSSFVSWF